MPTETKAFYKSKTLWANLLLLVAAILAMPEVKLLPINPEWIAGAAVVINTLLRFFTDKPLSATGGTQTK